MANTFLANWVVAAQSNPSSKSTLPGLGRVAFEAFLSVKTFFNDSMSTKFVSAEISLYLALTL